MAHMNTVRNLTIVNKWCVATTFLKMQRFLSQNWPMQWNCKSYQPLIKCQLFWVPKYVSNICPRVNDPIWGQICGKVIRVSKIPASKRTRVFQLLSFPVPPFGVMSGLCYLDELGLYLYVAYMGSRRQLAAEPICFSCWTPHSSICFLV